MQMWERGVSPRGFVTHMAGDFTMESANAFNGRCEAITSQVPENVSVSLSLRWREKEGGLFPAVNFTSFNIHP